MGGDWILVGKVGEVPQSFRAKVGNRVVVFFHKEGKYYCVDGNCYHAGAKLTGINDDDIENINGEPCIRCPLHKFTISLTTGESFYQEIVGFEDVNEGEGTKKVPIVGNWKSKGRKQRCHTVREHEGELYVQLNCEDIDLESDAFSETRACNDPKVALSI